MNESSSPYVCHVFVCLNDRQGASKACADGDAIAVRKYLKEQVAARGWKPRVRVSQAGCLGLCAKGPNVMLYPQGLWFSGVTMADADHILDRIRELVG